MHSEPKRIKTAPSLRALKQAFMHSLHAGGPGGGGFILTGARKKHGIYKINGEETANKALSAGGALLNIPGLGFRGRGGGGTPGPANLCIDC